TQGRDTAEGKDAKRCRRPAAAARDETVLNTSDRWQIRRNSVGWRPAVEKDIDVQALSAAIAGFLACHVLTCRFLVQEGVVEKDRFTAYLEAAMAEVAPGIEDKRTLFSLRQLIAALRAPPPRPTAGQYPVAAAVAHAHRRRRTRDRASDRLARPPAGARPPLGAARGAVSDQEARANHGAARHGDANRARKNRNLPGLRQYRHPESLHGLHR